MARYTTFRYEQRIQRQTLEGGVRLENIERQIDAGHIRKGILNDPCNDLLIPP